ncbi:AmmeMemoRadiSam system protein B [Candidatus Micrarchaeota archaeon]|nr:AmmeMemoRadiSam system protein B [Candidatus Micrarchaeota archaeon]MBU1930197.1 AmmeMemoRadiSam system protein B [Candidatus Micrarchaeota archaeon]
MKTRSMAAAGSFYPIEKKELEQELSGYLKGTPKKLAGKLKAIIAPHAGYIYSGAVAGKAFQLFQQLPRKEWEILLLGPSHTMAFEGASISLAEQWETPLGTVPVSKRATKMVSRIIQNIEEAHFQEHDLEVEIPFLQKTLKQFSIIPIVAGMIDGKVLAIELENQLKKNTLLVVSSDLSHYLPHKQAVKVDSKTIQAILELNTEKIEEIGDACGKIPIITLLHLAKKKKWKPVLLDYKNSGDTAGDKSRVVGYAAIAFME